MPPRTSAARRRLPSAQNAVQPSPAAGTQQSAVVPATAAGGVQRFWQAIRDTAVHNAPLGNAVARVAAGTVVAERMRCTDHFNDLWVATVDEDGEAAWLRPMGEEPLSTDDDDSSGDDKDSAREVDWAPAVDTEGLPPAADGSQGSGGAADGGSVTAAAARAMVPSAPTHRHECNLATGAGEGAFEASLIGQYWRPETLLKDRQAPGHRDWNHEYQRLVEAMLYGASNGPDAVSGGEKPQEHDPDASAMDALRAELHTLVQDFADHVETTTVALIAELYGNAARSLVRHPSVPGVFYRLGTYFRLAVDSDGTLAGDDGAVKLAAQRSRVAQRLCEEAPLHRLSAPLAVCMSFGGYRVLAFAIPPLGPVEQLQPVATGPALRESIEGLAAALNVAPFEDSDGGIHLAPSCAVYAGKDCRLYVLGGSDLLPPFAPASNRVGFSAATSGRLLRLRPEAVSSSPVPLSACAFAKGTAGQAGAGDREQALRRMNRWVRGVGLATAAAVLGFMEPCTVPGLEPATCGRCERRMEDELRFAVCASQCCFVCPQCYITASEALLIRHEVDASAAMIAEAVRCGAAPVDSVRSAALFPPVCDILHHCGVNLRLLAAVEAQLPRSARAIMGHFIECEVIARATKHVLSRRLRRVTDAAGIAEASAHCFMALMQPDGDLAEAFWAQELGPAIQRMFDVFVPFDTEVLDIARVSRRVCELTGIELTDESIASFAHHAPGRATSSSSSSDSDEDTKEKGKGATRSSGAGASRRPSAATTASDVATKTAQRPPAFVQLRAVHPVMKRIRIPALCEEVGARRAVLQDAHVGALLLLWNQLTDGRDDEYQPYEALQPHYLRDGQTA